MTSYYWYSPISKLREDGFITSVLEQGLTGSGIETLGDLRTGKDKLDSQYLRTQAAHLYDFLQVAIYCDSHNCAKEEVSGMLPYNLVKASEYVYCHVCHDVTSKTIVGVIFKTPIDFLYALLIDKTTMFNSGYRHFDRKADFDYYRNTIVSIVQDLVFYCECFPDCQYYGRHLKNMVIEAVSHYEVTGARLSVQTEYTDKNSDNNELDKIFSKTLAHYALRTRNVLLYNGITSINAFKPWLNDKDKEFLSLKGCGRKSATELELFRTELLTALSEQAESHNDCQKKEGMSIFETAIDTWHNLDARHHILEVFGSSRAFVTSFIFSAQNTFRKLSTTINKPFEFFTSIIELIASVIVSGQNEELSSSMFGPLKCFEKLFKNDSQKMLADSLLTDDKKKLILAEFNRNVSTLSVRSRHALFRIVNADNIDSVVYFLNSRHYFTSLSKIGEKSDLELKGFVTQMGSSFASVLFTEDDTAKYETIIEDFPFLNTTDAQFVYSFNSAKGHFPMFFVAWKYFTGCSGKAYKLYRDYYGMGQTDFPSLDVLANKYHLTRERTRQIVTTPQKLSFYGKNPLLMGKHWKAYPFVYADTVTENSSGFESLASEEHLDLSFFTFCGIVNFISPKIIEKKIGDNDTSMTVAYSTRLRSFKLHSALREINRLRDTGKNADVSISLHSHISGNKKYWSGNAYLETDKTTMAFKLMSEIICKLNIVNMDENGNMLFKANRTNYSDVIYGILNEHGKPMHIDEILVAFKEKLPEDSHNTVAALKYFIMKDGRIEPIGRTSTYKLTSWNDYSGSIPKLIVDILLDHNIPIETSKLVEEALKYRKTSTKRSIESNINQKVADGTLKMYYPNLVGLNGKSYEEKFKIVPTNFEQYLNAFVDFVEEHKRFPVLAKPGYESMLYRWHSNAKSLVSLTDQEIIRFSQAMKMLEAKHYAHGMMEFNFLIKCDQYKQFVSVTGHVLTEEDDKSLASWFIKSAMQYQSWKDNRNYYFKELLQFISKKIE